MSTSNSPALRRFSSSRSAPFLLSATPNPPSPLPSRIGRSKSSLAREGGLRKLPLLVLLLSALLLPGLQAPVSAQGGSAVITLVMPVGARQLGMGEAALALADDAYATYWNPAGLAFGPLSNEWELALKDGFEKEGVQLRRGFTVLAAKPRTGFLNRPLVWAGGKTGLLRFDGKAWRDYHEYPMEQGDAVESVVRKYIGSGEGLDSLVEKVRAYNKIGDKKEEEDLIALRIPFNLLFPGEAVTALVLDGTDRIWVGTTGGLYRFDGSSWKSFAREEGFTMVRTPVPAASARAVDSVAASPADSLKAAPSAGAADSASASGGGPVADNVPEVMGKSVTALAVKGSSLWIGTTDGLFEYKKNVVARRGQNLLPSQHIVSIAVHENIDEIYVATRGRGVARYTPPRGGSGTARWKLFSTADGLLDTAVSQALLDRFGHLWVAHPKGVSHFNLRGWEKINFRKQEVRSLALGDDASIWIGTNEGAWKHTPNHATAKGRLLSRKGKDEADGSKDRKGGWYHFHSGNGLSDKNVLDIETQGDDVWFITEAGIERYNTAKSQVGFFYESLLPVLNLPDLYHAYLAGTFPIEEWGTVGGFVNFVSFGENVETDANDNEIRRFNSTETVASLSYGTRLSRNLGLGLNVKFIYSALAPGIGGGSEGDGIAASYAVDAGLLYRDLLFPGLSLAFVAQNMGPAVFYVDQSQSDPIPFTWKVGAAYRVLDLPSHKLVVAADANREAVYKERGETEPDPFYTGAFRALIDACQEDDAKGVSCNNFTKNLYYGVYNTGIEYVYANVVAGRAGYLHDESGERFEVDLGLGFMLSDILQIDGAYIKALNGGIRDGQKRFSMILRF